MELKEQFPPVKSSWIVQAWYPPPINYMMHDQDYYFASEGEARAYAAHLEAKGHRVKVWQ